MLLKKIIIGVLSGALLVVLIVGGVNRTMAKTSDELGNEAGAGRGRNAQSEGDDLRPLKEAASQPTLSPAGHVNG